jgi:hypothetical protein
MCFSVLMIVQPVEESAQERRMDTMGGSTSKIEFALGLAVVRAFVTFVTPNFFPSSVLVKDNIEARTGLCTELEL